MQNLESIFAASVAGTPFSAPRRQRDNDEAFDFLEASGFKRISSTIVKLRAANRVGRVDLVMSADSTGIGPASERRKIVVTLSSGEKRKKLVLHFSAGICWHDQQVFRVAAAQSAMGNDEFILALKGRAEKFFQRSAKGGAVDPLEKARAAMLAEAEENHQELRDAGN